ncbi:hypothetical protein [Candidatus Berkiella aquae]|uniref:Uncharacterized protein n=1 Tax=Candidatus Berkiella aquae TaxID=295108 RepID=A0A0Q9YQD1_9GAMM|nr:hypothetical protein [Candidatus Berkiella aquae]MCS5711640.1 hypothetical protein [Candidatus Berkiella aquae]
MCRFAYLVFLIITTTSMPVMSHDKTSELFIYERYPYTATPIPFKNDIQKLQEDILSVKQNGTPNSHFAVPSTKIRLFPEKVPNLVNQKYIPIPKQELVTIENALERNLQL